MMTIEEMLEKKREYGYSYEQIAKLSGLPIGTVQKVLGGFTKSPRYKTLQALEKVFRDAEPESAENQKIRTHPEYLLRDGTEWSSSARIEAALVDPRQQLINGRIYSQLSDYIDASGSKSQAFLTPIDVMLPDSQQTVVRPDVFVMDSMRRIGFRLAGVPMLVIEMVTPVTRWKYQLARLQKYLEAGVREYWLVDPDQESVVVYDLGDMRGETDGKKPQKKEISVYNFQDEIPVQSFEGKCRIQMARSARAGHSLR